MPYETYTVGGGEKAYSIVGYDANGCLVGDVEASISLADGVE